MLTSALSFSVLLLLLVSVQAAAHAQQPGWYHIETKVSGLFLDVLGGSQDVGAPIVQAQQNPQQVWNLIPAPGGAFWLQSSVSGWYLDVHRGTKTVGPHVVQAPRHPAQTWRFIDAGGEWFYIQSQASELFLDVLGGNTHVGARVGQAPRHPAQVWRLHPASEPSHRKFPLTFRQEDDFGSHHMISEVTVSKNGRVDVVTETNDHVWLKGNCGSVAVWLRTDDGNFIIRGAAQKFCVGSKGFGGAGAESGPVRKDAWDFSVSPEQLKEVGGVAVLHSPNGDPKGEANAQRVIQIIKSCPECIQALAAQ